MVIEPIATSRRIDLLAPDEPGEQAEIEGLLVRAARTRRTHQQRGAVPDLLQAEFRHRHRRLGRRARVAHQQHATLAIAADHQGGAAIGEQQQDRRRAVDLHQLAEGEPDAAGPQPGPRNISTSTGEDGGAAPDSAVREGRARRHGSGRCSSPQPGERTRVPRAGRERRGSPRLLRLEVGIDLGPPGHLHLAGVSTDSEQRVDCAIQPLDHLMSPNFDVCRWRSYGGAQRGRGPAVADLPPSARSYWGWIRGGRRRPCRRSCHRYYWSA